jgi:hypothetical protein
VINRLLRSPCITRAHRWFETASPTDKGGIYSTARMGTSEPIRGPPEVSSARPKAQTERAVKQAEQAKLNAENAKQQVERARIAEKMTSDALLLNYERIKSRLALKALGGKTHYMDQSAV